MKLHGTTAIPLPAAVGVSQYLSISLYDSDLDMTASQSGEVCPERHYTQACADICAGPNVVMPQFL